MYFYLQTKEVAKGDNACGVDCEQGKDPHRPLHYHHLHRFH